MNEQTSDSRLERLKKKTAARMETEKKENLTNLSDRKDYFEELNYFMALAKDDDPRSTAYRTERPLAALLCVQAPLPLFRAAGLKPYKIFSGSQSAGFLTAPSLPALTCPMLRSTLGLLKTLSQSEIRALIIPTTCDWVVKFTEMAELCELSISESVFHLELPHFKDKPDGQDLWLASINKLTGFLSDVGSQKITRKNLAEAISIYQKAWRALTALTELRRQGRVSSHWFMLVTGTFFLDDEERWTKAVEKLLPVFEGVKPDPDKPRIFLAGSPLCLPDFKLPNLFDEAGLTVTGDDLCSSERLFHGLAGRWDHSVFGQIQALAQAYHQGCLCPTFADNDRRINNILRQSHDFDGVVFQILKGCHPYDLEGFGLEKDLKKQNIKFIRLETDFTIEDYNNLLTRLEAFKHNL